MRQSSQQSQIKQQLSNFINLLQNDFQNNTHNSPTQTRGAHQYTLQKKLSIIYSASEPQSSSLDKQNSNPSANRSFASSEKPILYTSYQTLVHNLLLTNLSVNQVKVIQKLKMYFDELQSQNEKLLNQISQLKTDLNAQKSANDEMLAVLVKLDKQEKELWGNYNLLSEKYQEVTQKYKNIEPECQKLRESVMALQNDNDFMKKLIFHANQNYQSLEKKCSQLENHRQNTFIYTDRKGIKKSSTDNLLKSAKTKKNGYSPSHSELGRTPSPDNFQDIYRKMIIRTLKFKGKNH